MRTYLTHVLFRPHGFAKAAAKQPTGLFLPPSSLRDATYPESEETQNRFATPWQEKSGSLPRTASIDDIVENRFTIFKKDFAVCGQRPAYSAGSSQKLSFWTSFSRRFAYGYSPVCVSRRMEAFLACFFSRKEADYLVPNRRSPASPRPGMM